MTAAENVSTSLAEKVGTWMFLAWFVVLGPIGLALWCGLAYAMYASNLALGIVCFLLLSAPLLLMVVWLPLIGLKLLEERAAAGEPVPAEVDTTS